jgi:site-specific recombinase XerD
VINLETSKTGQKTFLLNAGALEVLSGVPRVQDKEYVFPAASGNEHYAGTPKVWRRIREMAGLHDVRIHDLRHSFASIAVSGGASLPIIGALLGHKDSATTQRYAHLQNDPLKAANDSVSRKIAASLAEPSRAELRNLRDN